MFSGAVIISDPIGERISKPFDIERLVRVQKNPELFLDFQCPFDIAYLPCLESSDACSYQEGVLVNVPGGGVCSSDEFRESLLERMRCASEALGRGLYYDVVETYPARDAGREYFRISNRLIRETCVARIRVYAKVQEVRAAVEIERAFDFQDSLKKG